MATLPVVRITSGASVSEPTETNVGWSDLSPTSTAVLLPWPRSAAAGAATADAPLAGTRQAAQRQSLHTHSSAHTKRPRQRGLLTGPLLSTQMASGWDLCAALQTWAVWRWFRNKRTPLDGRRAGLA